MKIKKNLTSSPKIPFIEFDHAIVENHISEINTDKGSCIPYYNMDKEVKTIINPMKVEYGNNFIKECQNNSAKCQGKVTRENYEKLTSYIQEKFFENAQIYNSNDCKKVYGNNDLSYYWCKNKKYFYNYNFEIFFLVINIIITCLIVFLFLLVH